MYADIDVNTWSFFNCSECVYRHSLTTEQGDSTLSIANFGSSNDGTYICRTENIAGRDAASIVLSSGILLCLEYLFEW